MEDVFRFSSCRACHGGTYRTSAAKRRAGIAHQAWPRRRQRAEFLMNALDKAEQRTQLSSSKPCWHDASHRQALPERSLTERYLSSQQNR